MTDLPEWKPDCGCKIELREFRITRDFKCECHHADGSVKTVPLRAATIEEMAQSGQQSKYWAKRRQAQLDQIVQAEAVVEEAKAQAATPLAKAPNLDGPLSALVRAKQGRVHVCPAGCVYMPGTRIKGVLVSRCAAHQDLDDDNLQAQRWTKACGCVVDQITAGEGRCHGPVLTQTIKLCPLHEIEGA